jgi:O-methyltransferase
MILMWRLLLKISPDTRHAGRLYLDLLKACLTRLLFPDRNLLPNLVDTEPFSITLRTEGKDWPTEAETMIGLRRLNSIEQCAVFAIENDIPGDFVEAGVWRGGASILMRGILRVYGDNKRCVWLADSFQGLPQPDPINYPKDAGDIHATFNSYLGVDLDTVRNNFRRYSLLDSQVRFLPGWFKDTLLTAPIRQIALLRLDGDMYESTMETLKALYDRVSPGGFVIVDDYGCVPGCRAAVDDFRCQRGLTESIRTIDWTGVYWQKQVASGTTAEMRSSDVSQ